MYVWKNCISPSLSHKKVCHAVTFYSNLSCLPFLKVGLEILKMKPYHSVPHLIQTCLCVIVNSWSVLNIKATWFNYSIVKYSMHKVSTRLKSCHWFQAFKILIIYCMNIATASFPTKKTKLLLKEFDTKYCTRLCLYTPTPPLGPTVLYP